MVLNIILGFLAVLSVALLLWQWLAARRFPLHQRVAAHSFPLAVTLLKPLKGCEPSTEECLRSWFAQEYTGRVQILFGVASADDSACGIVHKLQQEFPHSDSQLIVCGPPSGPNAKVSKLAELERLAKHDLLVISDADVQVPPDFLANLVEPLRESDNPEKQTPLTPALSPSDGERGKAKISSSHALLENPPPSHRSSAPCGLVNCFYRLANPTTVAMRWEAVAINADFWSQVLQSQTLKPLDFALGAVMATRRAQVQEIGGFAALVDCLADDYQLGNRIARRGYRIALTTVVVECWSPPMNWRAVWKHQLRWARTIRVCQPAPYFFSILSNPTLWPLVWLMAQPSRLVLAFCLGCWLARILAALDLQRRLTLRREHFAYWWLVPLKDLLQTVLWLLAFTGNRIEWRGERMCLRRDGTLVKP